jgi:hypothetical protein
MIALAMPTALLAVDDPNDEKDKNDKTPVIAAPQATPLPATVNGAFFFGGMYNDNDGNLYRVGKYNTLTQGGIPRLGVALEGNSSGGVFYDLSGRYADETDQQVRLDADIKRYVDLQVSFNRSPVRFDNDPLTYADASVSNFVVRADHFDPERELDMTHSDFDARATVTVPGAEALKIFAGYHRDVRSGHDYAITASKCSNCHLDAELRPIDQVTNDYDVGAMVQMAKWALEYQYRHRNFEEREAPPTNTYDDPLHPASLAPVFGNRVSYSTLDGPLPFFQVADHSKDSHRIRGRATLPADVKVNGSFSHIETTNDNTGVQATSQGWKGRVVVPIRRGMSFQVTARGYDVEVDDYFVDIVEPVSPGGPTAGQTYQQFYPEVGSIDFLRQSERNRSPTQFMVDFNYKPLPRTSLTVGYEHEVIDREHFDIERTVTDVLKFGLNTRFGRRVKSRTTLESSWIDDPFAAAHAAIPAVLQPDPSPGATPFFGLQYFQMYDARQAALTALPDRVNHFFQSVSWTPSSRFALVGHYRYRGRSNDTLNFSEWERTVHLPGVEMWFAADERWYVTAGYNYMRDQAKTLYSVLAFDG